MQSPLISSTFETNSSVFSPSRTVRLRLHSRRSPRAIEARATVEPSPLHSARTFVATMFVMSVAVGWIAVATTATAPLIAAGEMLNRAARNFEK